MMTHEFETRTKNGWRINKLSNKASERVSGEKIYEVSPIIVEPFFITEREGEQGHIMLSCKFKILKNGFPVSSVYSQKLSKDDLQRYPYIEHFLANLFMELYQYKEKKMPKPSKKEWDFSWATNMDLIVLQHKCREFPEDKEYVEAIMEELKQRTKESKP